MEMKFRLEDIQQVAAQLREKAGNANVIAFHGAMGAGKTTLINAFCRELGVQSGFSSPTFSIINEYEYNCEGTRKPLFHIDLYRLKDEVEAISVGVEDCLYSGYLCLVEWPEKAPALFPDNTVHVHLELVDSQTRQLKSADI